MSMRPTQFHRSIKWVFSGGGYGADNRRGRRLERRARGREAAEEIAAEIEDDEPVLTYCATCNGDFDNRLPHLCPGGPEEGHTFRFEVSSRMSSSVVGDPVHTDADYFGPPHVLHVRAWSLPQALEKASALPFSAWTLWPEADDD